MNEAPSIFWFRRDLRLADNPSLLAAIDVGVSDQVLPLFIVDPNLVSGAGLPRLAYLAQSLCALDESLGGNLHVIAREPREVLSQIVNALGTSEVQVTEDFAPFGIARDSDVEASGVKLLRAGSPYAISPGRVRKNDGTN